VALFIQRPVFTQLPQNILEEWTLKLSDILGYIKGHSRSVRDSEFFIAEANLDATTVFLTITNCGTPLEISRFREHFKGYADIAISSNSDDRSGQKIFAEFDIPDGFIKNRSQEELPELDELHVRELHSGEEFLVSKLFYNVYRYRYINSKVYDPETIAHEISSGKLISYVGITSGGEIVSHVGLVLCNDNPKVYEAAWGVVDPLYANRGIFKRTFEAALDRMQKTPMSYSIYDFVTNHDFSQRLVAKYGYKDMAIFVGNQVSETQARMSEISNHHDLPGMERYSLLVGIDQRNSQPFGNRIKLPINIGETCDFLLSNLGMTWEPTNRFESLPVGGHYSVKIQHEQKSVIFDLYDVGRNAVERILIDLSHQLRTGLEYAAVEFPLNVPGVGYIHDALADAGFFMAGLIPYRFTNQLGFRMQFLTPTDLDFNAIKVHSPVGNKLLQIVRDEWERNHLI
jgi:hypothetical protein